jgi:hypothetical protein
VRFSSESAKSSVSKQNSRVFGPPESNRSLQRQMVADEAAMYASTRERTSGPDANLFAAFISVANFRSCRRLVALQIIVTGIDSGPAIRNAATIGTHRMTDKGKGTALPRMLTNGVRSDRFLTDLMSE